MQRPDWAPEGIDMEQFSAARVYDYLLGGSHNFAVDREYARRGLTAIPDLAIQAQANRAFLHRAVRHLTDAGVRQFLDLGSGIPTRGNVHEVAQRAAPDARVVYVDIDPVAVAHSRHMLLDNDLAIAIQEDMRQPETIFANPELGKLLDLDQPVAVLMLAVLHAIPDEADPYGIIARIRDVLPNGSYLVLAQASHESRPEGWRQMVEMSRNTPYPLTPRSQADISRFFEGLTLVEPGVVWAPLWHPEHPDDVDNDPGRSSNMVGVGRKM
ncbi:SAM-dependent methyltransferase [Micromonospora sonneratiae]|uniref:SAM-dependent methyltransferase n=1 Tax=Micromonospora sonneratiae TaxID=1184706 RepID=A0ABW3YNT3_9ACTN